MKILYLGQLDYGQTALMRMRALERLGHSVRGVHTSQAWKGARWVTRQVQRRIHRGSIVEEINSTILSAACEFKPDLLWADKQEFLRAETVEELRRSGAKTVHFTPDPYFSLPGSVRNSWMKLLVYSMRLSTASHMSAGNMRRSARGLSTCRSDIVTKSIAL